MKITIHIATIDHRHGTSCFASISEDDLNFAVETWCRQFAGTEGVVLPDTLTTSETIDAYFNKVTGESVDYEEVEVDLGDAFNDAVESAIERRMNEDLGAILAEHEDKIKRRLVDPMAEALRNAAAVIGELDSQISQMEGLFSDDDGQIAEARDEAEETCNQIEAMLKNHKAGEPLPVPEIYITMDGGLIEDVYSSGSLVGASYTIIDYDTEGAEEVQFIERTDGTLTEAYIGGGTIGEFTSKILAEVEGDDE